MAEGLLLDTNVAIALMSENTSLENIVTGKEIYIPVTVIGELLFGAQNSAKTDDNLNKIFDFVSKRTVLNCDVETAKWYGLIRKQLRSKGRPIPQNDVWIAAITYQYQLVLVTRDKHFEQVDDLVTQDW